MKRFGKKGMEDKQMFAAWEMIVLAMVIIALVVAVKGVSTNSLYWKKYHSADTAMITDMMLIGQGDFIINYNLKDIQKNWATRLFSIDSPKFLVFLNPDKIMVYDDADDKYPQGFIFAASKIVNVMTGKISGDFIVISKEGDTLTMADYYRKPEIICPSSDTTKNHDDVKIDSVALDAGSEAYASYLDALFNTYGNETAYDDIVLFIKSSSGTPEMSVTYKSGEQLTSGKLACLLSRQFQAKYADTAVTTHPYDGSSDSVRKFMDNEDKYNHWIIISQPNLSKEEFGALIGSVVEAYYE